MRIMILLLCIVSISVAPQAKEKGDLALLALQPDDQDQEMFDLLKRRRRMLNWHTYTAWASVGLMSAALLTTPEGDYSNTHKWLGIASGVLYVGSAALAAFAPKSDDMKDAKNIWIHKKLIWIHAPAMLMTIYSGIKAHQDRKDGKDLSTMGKMHSPLAAITAISFGLAAVASMDWTLSLLPTNKKGDVACVFTRRF